MYCHAAHRGCNTVSALLFQCYLYTEYIEVKPISTAENTIKKYWYSLPKGILYRRSSFHNGISIPCTEFWICSLAIGRNHFVYVHLFNLSVIQRSLLCELLKSTNNYHETQTSLILRTRGGVFWHPSSSFLNWKLIKSCS